MSTRSKWLNRAKLILQTVLIDGATVYFLDTVIPIEYVGNDEIEGEQIEDETEAPIYAPADPPAA